MYDILHVLHVSFYIPLMLHSLFFSGVFGFVVLYCVCAFECNIYVGMFESLVSFLICGL